jgi:exopolysaccharide biosynthesis polyprenyl glycosylphosphotransferase
MAVASQTIPGALRAPELRGLPVTRTGVHARVAPRWAQPAFVLTGDLLVVAAAALVGGGGSVLATLYVPVAIACLAFSGAYRRRMSLRALDLTPWLVTRLAVPLLVLAPAVIAGVDATPLLVTALIAVGLLVPTRVLTFGLLRHTRRRGHLLDPTVILGAGEVGSELGSTFLDYPEYGVVPVGFLDCVDGNLPAPLLGDVDRLDDLLETHDIRRVIVAFGPARESELVGVLRTAVTHDVDISVIPRFFDNGVVPEGPDTDDVRGIPLYRVRQSALRKPVWVLKRAVDIMVAGTVLLLAAPILLVCGLAVKLSSPGPVLFRQRRIGQGGRTIEVPKIRSLRVNHDSDTQWAVDDDPRVTGVGRFMRRTSIDELPQLWSVLKGDMSLVGPRPERPLFVKRFSADVWGYGDRHRVPVGLTGWAQVHGLRGDTSIEERARFDNQYIEHWSLWRDVVVLFRSLAEVVRGAKHNR